MKKNKKYVSLELAKLAKELGFNEPTYFMYHPQYGIYLISHDNPEIGTDFNFSWQNDSYYSAPTLSELQTWLRDEHNIIVEITYEQADKTFWHNGYFLDNKDWTDFEYYQTYEEALEDGLKYGLNILKNINTYEDENN